MIGDVCRGVLAGCLLLLVTVTAQQVDDLARLLPAEMDGWKADGKDGVYTAKTLYDYIDGGAELYISFGVQRVLSRQYVAPRQADASITADVFDMGASENAFGVFVHGGENPTGEVGQGSEYTGGLLTFWKGRYYVSILGYPESADIERAVRKLGASIAAAIRDTGPIPSLVSSLPSVGLTPNSIRYFRHHVWLNSHTFVADTDILQMGVDSEAALARYQAGDRTWILLVVAYPDETRADRGHASFLKAYLPSAAAGVGLRPDGKWAGSVRSRRLVAVVLNAPDAETVRRALEESSRQ